MQQYNSRNINGLNCTAEHPEGLEGLPPKAASSTPALHCAADCNSPTTGTSGESPAVAHVMLTIEIKMLIKIRVQPTGIKCMRRKSAALSQACSEHHRLNMYPANVCGCGICNVWVGATATSAA